MGKCPVCSKEESPSYRPFCSKRCADVDLNRWFSGAYVIHTNETPEEDEKVNSAITDEI